MSQPTTNCYLLANQPNGSVCYDSKLGKMIWSDEWGGWGKAEYFVDENGGIYADLNDTSGGWSNWFEWLNFSGLFKSVLGENKKDLGSTSFEITQKTTKKKNNFGLIILAIIAIVVVYFMFIKKK